MVSPGGPSSPGDRSAGAAWGKSQGNTQVSQLKQAGESWSVVAWLCTRLDLIAKSVPKGAVRPTYGDSLTSPAASQSADRRVADNDGVSRPALRYPSLHP